MDDTETIGFKPPYGSFQTFWGFIDTLAQKPLPPQIDRSLFAGKSGTDQNTILTALRSFDLVSGPNQTVRAALDALVAADKDERKGLLVPILRRYYPRQLAVSEQNGTEKMLLDSFEEEFGLTGETRRKAATFFLHAARAAGLTLSPNFPKTRSGSGAPVGSRARRTVKRKKEVDATPPPTLPAGGKEDRYSVDLEAGGTVTLIVDVGHFALSRHKNDREFVQKLIDALVEYEDGRAAEQVSEEESEVEVDA